MDSESERARNRRRRADELHEDLIAEILARLPVKSLLRFKTVSKLWYSLILSPNFIAIHSNHSHRVEKKAYIGCLYSPGLRDTVALCYWSGEESEELTFRDQCVSVAPVDCYNGLVCLSLRDQPSFGRVRRQRYALWNPATRQLREIGNAPMPVPEYTRSRDWYGSGFCFDAVTNSFKVTLIKLNPSGGETRAQVNVFSTATNSWIEKIIGVPYRISGCDMSATRGISCAKRYLHWLITIKVDGDDSYILSYDMIDQVFKRIEMPFCPVPGSTVELANCNESLTLFVRRKVQDVGTHDVSYDEIDVDVWVMNDCGGANQSWSKLLTCRRPSKIAPGVVIKHSDRMARLMQLEEMRSVNGTFVYSESLASLNRSGFADLSKEAVALWKDT